MNKIPTAKEFLKDKWDRENGTNTYNILEKDNALDCLKEFAKLHVKAALKAALVNVDVDMNGTNKNQLPNPHFQIIVDSILNAYPETNIK